MFLDRQILCACVVLASITITGCSSSDTRGIDPAIESAKARVKFKDQGRYVRDLASGLGLGQDEVCKELGLYDCYEVAHRITLGGVEPYNRGIREPLPVAPVTKPIAADRVALNACATRVDRDFDTPGEALMFGDLATIGPTEEQLEAAANLIYERLLRRAASTREVRALVSFYDEAVEELDGTDDDPTREWAVGSCFAVATTMEGLFY